jgi:hypothetical protein
MMSCTTFPAGLLMSAALLALPAWAHGPGHDHPTSQEGVIAEMLQNRTLRSAVHKRASAQ